MTRASSVQHLQEPDSLPETSPETSIQKPGKGKPLALVSEPEQTRIKAFAERIKALNDLKQAFGRVPKGECQQAAEFKCSAKWIMKSMRLQREYLMAYPDEPFYHAHTPRQEGRPKGRMVSDEVRNAIELARVNQRWLSRDGSGGFDEIDTTLEGKLIHSLVLEHFGVDFHLRTTYRILDDYRQKQAVRIQVADYGVSSLQNNMPTIDNRPSAPGERAQFDIRPLPCYVNYDGIICTVHVLVVFEDFSGYIASHALIPGKRLDDDGEVCKQTFTTQMSRAVVAQAVMNVGRFRILYADHGFEALHKFMPFMRSVDEPGTSLIHSRVERPRGRGYVERGLQLIDGFLKLRPNYIKEREFRRKYKDSIANARTFEQCCEEFAAYVEGWNNDLAPDGGPSRADVMKQGTTMFLSAPAPEDLAIFAMSQQRVKRTLNRDGSAWFSVDAQTYEAASHSAELYKELTNLSSRGEKLDVLVFDFGIKDAEKIVLFSTDGEHTWHLAVPSGMRGVSGRRHTEAMKQVEQHLDKSDASHLDTFFKKIILGSAKGPLVINAFARNRHFYHHGSPADIDLKEMQPSREEENTQASPIKGSQEDPAGKPIEHGADNETLSQCANDAPHIGEDTASEAKNISQHTSPPPSKLKAPDIFEKLRELRHKKEE